MKGVTDKQREVLDYINQFGQEQGMAPTISEISEHFGVTPATAFSHIRALQRKGLLNRSSNKARSISVPGINNRAHHFSMSLSIPILGRISAGAPAEAEENIERYITLDPSLIPHRLNGQQLFAVRVSGESMRDAGILDGDLLVAQKQDAVKLGDIVIALVDDAVTVKYIYLTDGKWELRPANPDYKSRFVELDALKVQGTVVGLLRNY